MIKCIIHTADLHIKNKSSDSKKDARIQEEKETMINFINQCKEIVSNYKREECRIVICGDLTHSKSNVSNELFSFTADFLRELEQLCNVIIICGNHDIAYNSERQDTLSAIVQTARFNNVTYLDSIAGYESMVISDDNVNWCLYSIFDDFRRPDIVVEEGKTNFGLFHGDLVGAKLYNGSVMSMGCDCDIFESCDFVLASHIHQRQVLKHKGVDIVFPSSLVQQNYGESITQHGFCLWEYDEEKNEYNYRFIDTPTNYPLIKIEISNIEDIENDNEILLNL